MTRSSARFAAALAVSGLLGCGAEPKPQAPPATETAAPASSPGGADAVAPEPATKPAEDRPRLVSPVKGVARIEITRPSTRIVKNEVITTYLLKNLEPKPIAGFKGEEHWYTAGGASIGSNVYRHKRPIQPSEVIQVEFRMQRHPQQSRNTFTFSHINGEIKQTVVPKLELPKAEEPDKPKT